jgi:perosamine synthetase
MMKQREARNYQDAVRRAFGFLKRSNTFSELVVKGLPLEQSGGMLVAIGDGNGEDQDLVRTLSEWRLRNITAYPTRFPVTEEGTRKWVRAQLLEREDRILFLVVDRTGRWIGHLGFSNCFNEDGEMEVDNVVRGVAGVEPGIMGEAMDVLLRWGRTQIGAEVFVLRVFEENGHAVEFYRRCGFVLQERIRLRRTESSGVESYVPCGDVDTAPEDSAFLKMRWVEGTWGGADMILTAGPSVGEREAYYAWDAARNGWNTRWSGYLTRFEKAFSAYVGAEHCLATSCCTGALHIAMAALEIGPGDEVIVPDITWVATANAVRYVGATPVFADVEEDSWCLDPASFEKKITDRTRAVIPVHLYGHPARMDKILEIARRRGLYVVEDAAPSIGAEWMGRRTGGFGDFACFSFQGAKLLVTGEGGALLTSNPELYQKALKIWDQGRNPAKTFWIDAEGLKYKMSNVQAALGLAQIERCEEQVEMKRRVFEWYREELEGCPGVKLMPEVGGARSIYWMSNCRLLPSAGLDREDFRARLKERKIDTRPVFPAISQYPIWEKVQAPEPMAWEVGRTGINLPSGVCLTREQVRYVSRTMRAILEGNGG